MVACCNDKLQYLPLYFFIFGCIVIIITLLTNLQRPYFVDLVDCKTEKKKKKMHSLVAQHSCLHCGVSCYSFAQLSQVEEIDNLQSESEIHT